MDLPDATHAMLLEEPGEPLGLTAVRHIIDRHGATLAKTFWFHKIEFVW